MTVWLGTHLITVISGFIRDEIASHERYLHSRMINQESMGLRYLVGLSPYRFRLYATLLHFSLSTLYTPARRRPLI